MEKMDTYKPISHSVVCPQCRNLISYLDYPRSNHFGCPECGTFFKRTNDGTNYIIRKFNQENKITPDIPFGTKYKNATLVSVVYKRDPKEPDYFWKEYLFSMPGTDYYITLADLDGYWMLVYREPNQVQFNHDKTETFIYLRPFLSYQFELMYAEGEFNWDISGDEQLVTNEHLHNPDILINESGNGQSDWYRGSFVNPVDLAKQLNIPIETLSARKYFNPKTFYPAWNVLFKFSGVALGIFLLVAFIMSLSKPEKTIYEANFNCIADTSGWTSGSVAPGITGTFHVSGRGMVSVKTSAPQIDNNWLELELSLINNTTGEEYEADKTIEFYHGYEDGESWSEGSRDENVKFAGVPEGDYHLNIYPTIAADSKKTDTGRYDMSYSIAVNQNASMPGNFITTLLLLLAYPIIQFWRKKNYESKARNTRIYGALPTDK